MLSAFNDIKSTEKKMGIWFYYNVYHKIIPNFTFCFTRFLNKEYRCKTNLHTFGCHLYAGRIICRETDNWKTGFLACSKASEFRSHVPLFIHLFSLFGGSFITLHYQLSSVGERIIDLEPDRLSVWDTLLGAGEFKHGGQFYQDR